MPAPTVISQTRSRVACRRKALDELAGIGLHQLGRAVGVRLGIVRGSGPIGHRSISRCHRSVDPTGGQRLLQVGHQVLDRFDADGEPDEVGGTEVASPPPRRGS